MVPSYTKPLLHCDPILNAIHLPGSMLMLHNIISHLLSFQISLHDL